MATDGKEEIRIQGIYLLMVTRRASEDGSAQTDLSVMSVINSVCDQTR